MLLENKKIAIVHDFLLKLGGAEEVLGHIFRIFPEANVYTLLYDEAGTKKKFCKSSITTSYLQKKPTVAPRNFKLLLPKFPQAIERFDLHEYDLVISISNSFAHAVITSPQTLHICYSLSPTRYLYDWHNEYLEENKLKTGLKATVVKKILANLRSWDLETRDRPDAYISISEHVRKRLRKYYRLNSQVIYPPVDVKNIEPNLGEPENYYVIISRLTPYKKIDLAIKAFNQLDKSLIIIGTGEDERRLKSLAKKNIEFLGWQSKESLFEYLRNAKALIFPGEEDFGLTPIETMACGRPVIAFGKGGVTETVRDGIDGVWFNDPDSDALIEAVRKFEKLEFDPKKIRSHAERFSFEKFRDNFTKAIEKYAAK